MVFEYLGRLEGAASGDQLGLVAIARRGFNFRALSDSVSFNEAARRRLELYTSGSL